MRGRTLSILCVVLLQQAFALAQTPADPVSGNWGSDGLTFLELKFDGKRTVTGTAIWRGGGQEARTPIKSGTYDVKTRALKLEGDGTRPDGVSASYLIEGTIDGDKVSGRFTFGDGSGTFTFTRQTRVKDHLRIEARRIGPPRTMGPLAAPKAKTNTP